MERAEGMEAGMVEVVEVVEEVGAARMEGAAARLVRMEGTAAAADHMGRTHHT